MLGKSHNAYNHDSPQPSAESTERLKPAATGPTRIRLPEKDLQLGERLRAKIAKSAPEHGRVS
jgi:hypothetical protein